MHLSAGCVGETTRGSNCLERNLAQLAISRFGECKNVRH
jgi:hypothetical protein